MSTRVLFVQGAGPHAHDQWDEKLAGNLKAHLGDACDVRFPHMPDEADPQFSRWQAALRDEFATLGDGDVLVGHSIGGTILVHAIATQTPPFQPGGILLLAPAFIGEQGWHSDDITPINNFSSALPRDLPVRIYHAVDDETVPVVHSKLYAKAIPAAVVITVPKGGHSFGNDLRAVARDIRDLHRRRRSSPAR
jgi:predicted alpha/beta hydrolase family esterase